MTEWKRQFLNRRELSTPSGMPLYTYRVTPYEFEDLESLLRGRLAEWLKRGTLGDIAQQIPAFPALFVLYAAEWWRRRYDGSQWSWEPILEAIGAPPNGWNQAQRSACVERGLRDWRLDLTNTHGFRFLGSVAFQGGLPMQLLATAHGNIGRVLTQVLRLASNGSADANDIGGWVQSLSILLPQAYRFCELGARGNRLPTSAIESFEKIFWAE